MSNKAKILLVKHLGYGDIIMTLPSYFYLCDKYGKENIYWLADNKAKLFLSHILHEDNLLLIDTSDIHKSLFHKIKFIVKSNFLILRKKYNVIYILHGHPLYFLTAIINFWKVKLAITYKSGRQALVRNRYLGFNHYVFISNDDGPSSRFEFFFNKAANFIQNASSLQKNLLPNCRQYVVFCPGLTQNPGDSTSARRRLDPILWQQLSSELSKLGYNILVVGAPSEDDALKEIFTSGEVIMAGTNNFLQLGLLLKNAKFVLSTDNGLMHLSYIFGAKLLCFFGPTIGSERIPVFVKNAYIYEEPTSLICMPCFDGRTIFPCNKNLCLSTLSVASVIKQLSNIGFL